jgi:hypothetical protein
VRRVPPAGGTGRTVLPGALASERIEARWRVHFDDDRRIHRLLTFHEPEQGA